MCLEIFPTHFYFLMGKNSLGTPLAVASTYLLSLTCSMMSLVKRATFSQVILLFCIHFSLWDNGNSARRLLPLSGTYLPLSAKYYAQNTSHTHKYMHKIHKTVCTYKQINLHTQTPFGAQSSLALVNIDPGLLVFILYLQSLSPDHNPSHINHCALSFLVMLGVVVQNIQWLPIIHGIKMILNQSSVQCCRVHFHTLFPYTCLALNQNYSGHCSLNMASEGLYFCHGKFHPASCPTSKSYLSLKVLLKSYLLCELLSNQLS